MNIVQIAIPNTIFSNDDFDSVFSPKKEDRPPVIFEYSEDPFALVCAMKRCGKFSHEIHDAVAGIGLKNYTFDNVIETADREYAEEIRKFFKNSILMRRLKGLHISNFMIAVEELIDSPKKINQEHIKILVKLPDFFVESKETEKIFSQYNSLNKNKKEAVKFDEVITFAGKVRRVSKRENQTRYYFATPDKNIVSVFVTTSDQSAPVWDYISRKDKIRLKATMYVSSQPGHEFYFYNLGRDYEFSEAND